MKLLILLILIVLFMICIKNFYSKKVEGFNWFYPPSRCIRNIFGDTSCFPSRYPPSYGDPPYYPYYNGAPYYYSYYYPSYYPYYPSLSFSETY